MRKTISSGFIVERSSFDASRAVAIPLSVVFAVAVILALSFALTSCGGGEGRLKARSLEYYNYLTGANDLTSEMFDSPARLKSLTPDAREGMKRVAAELKKARDEIKKQTKVEPTVIDRKLVSVKVTGRFGITVVTARVPLDAVRTQVRWVRDRGRWYLFGGTEAEVDAYGEFPSDLVFEYEPAEKDAS